MGRTLKDILTSTGFDTEFVPGHIHKVVTIQVFDRSSDGELLVTESLTKYTGQLLNYAQDKERVVFTIEGGNSIVITKKTEYYEVYIHEGVS